MQKKEYTLGKGGEALTEGALGPSAADGTLGLFLLPAGRLGRRFTRADDEATAAAIVAATAPFLHRGADVQMRFTCVGHGAKCWKEGTLDEMKERKMMQRSKKLMTELGFLPSPNMLYL
jgi:hypothetical protein